MEDYVDESDFGDFAYTTDLYAWYVPGTHNPVFYTTSISVSGAVLQETTNYVSADDVRVESPEAGALLSVYPNPAAGMVTLTGADSAEEIVVTDVCGRMVHCTSPQTSLMQWDVSEWKPGVYNIVIR